MNVGKTIAAPPSLTKWDSSFEINCSHFDLPFEGREYPARMYFGHTDKGVSSLKGTKPSFGQYVGNQGDKGISSGPHLHIDLRMSKTATDGHVLEGFESAGS